MNRTSPPNASLPCTFRRRQNPPDKSSQDSGRYSHRSVETVDAGMVHQPARAKIRDNSGDANTDHREYGLGRGTKSLRRYDVEVKRPAHQQPHDGSAVKHLHDEEQVKVGRDSA